MPWEPTVADGSKIFVWITSAFVEIRGAKDFQLPQPTKADIPSGELRDVVEVNRGGKVNFGTATFTLMLDPSEATHARILSQGTTPGSTDIIYVEWNGGAQFTRLVGEFVAPGASFVGGSIIEGQAGFKITAAPTYPTTVPTA
jgi:hypothetical protein